MPAAPWLVPASGIPVLPSHTHIMWALFSEQLRVLLLVNEEACLPPGSTAWQSGAGGGHRLWPAGSTPRRSPLQHPVGQPSQYPTSSPFRQAQGPAGPQETSIPQVSLMKQSTNSQARQGELERHRTHLPSAEESKYRSAGQGKRPARKIPEGPPPPTTILSHYPHPASQLLQVTGGF